MSQTEILKGLPVYRFNSILLVVGLLLASRSTLGQEVCQPVFLIAPTQVRVPDAVLETYGSKSIGLRLFVTAVQDEWLWIAGNKPGWIPRQHVVVLADAERHFSRMIAQNPRSWTAYHGRAGGRMHSGRTADAVADLTHAIEFAPVNWQPYFLAWRSEAWLALGELERTIEDASAAIDHSGARGGSSPAMVNAHYFRGFAYHLQGRLADAELNYNEALLREPDKVMARLRRGVLRRDQSNFASAIDDFTAVLKIDSRFHSALNDRGTTWEMMGDWKAAAADYRAVLAQAPEAVFVTQSRESAVYGKGNFETEQVALLNPKRSAHYNLIMD